MEAFVVSRVMVSDTNVSLSEHVNNRAACFSGNHSGDSLKAVGRPGRLHQPFRLGNQLSVLMPASAASRSAPARISGEIAGG